MISVTSLNSLMVTVCCGSHAGHDGHLVAAIILQHVHGHPAALLAGLDLGDLAELGEQPHHGDHDAGLRLGGNNDGVVFHLD